MQTFNRNEGRLPVGEFSEEEREKRKKFEVSIFGTRGSKTDGEKKAVDIAGSLATKIVGNWHKIKTGGYNTGIMEAASKAGHEEALRLGCDELIPEGITIGDVLGKATEYAKITEEDTLLERLDNLEDTDAMVVLHGTSGTITELLTSIVDSTIKRMKNVKNDEFAQRPIVIADSSLRHVDLLDALKKLDPGMIGMFEHVYFVSSSNNQEAGEIVDEINFIIESYYRKSEGEELSDEDKVEIAKFDLKKFFDAKNEFTEGAGI